MASAKSIYNKRSNATLRKKIILKDNITTTYVEHKHKDTRTPALIYPQNVEKQYH